MTSVTTVAETFGELLSTNPARVAILAAKEHGVIMSKQTVTDMVKSIARFRWYTRRKRKRETTTVLGDCGICFESGITVERTRCGHDFCAGCLGSLGEADMPGVPCEYWVTHTHIHCTPLGSVGLRWAPSHNPAPMEDLLLEGLFSLFVVLPCIVLFFIILCCWRSV